MATVKISFTYDPDEPDDSSSTGMSEDEYNRVTGQLIRLGAEDIEMEKN